MRKEEAPSKMAASVKELGMPRINWRIKKMVIAPPPNQTGTHKGYNVPVQPIWSYTI